MSDNAKTYLERLDDSKFIDLVCARLPPGVVCLSRRGHSTDVWVYASVTRFRPGETLSVKRLVPSWSFTVPSVLTPDSMSARMVTGDLTRAVAACRSRGLGRVLLRPQFLADTAHQIVVVSSAVVMSANDLYPSPPRKGVPYA